MLKVLLKMAKMCWIPKQFHKKAHQDSKGRVQNKIN